MFKKIILIILISTLFLSGCNLNSLNNGESYTYNLEVSYEGEGTVIPAAETVSEPTLITLNPIPEQGWILTDWVGEDSDQVNYNPDTEQWEILVDQDKSITAVFSKKEYELNIDIIGKGSVREELKSTITGQKVEHGETVILTAEPDQGYFFDQWQGDLNSTDNPVEVTITEDKSITAVFMRAPSVSGTITVEYNSTDQLSSKLSVPEVNKPLTTDRKKEIVENQLVIGFSSKLSDTEKRNIIDKLNGKIIKKIKPLNAVLIRIPGNMEQNRIQAQSLPGVRYCEPDYRFEATANYLKTPDDEYYPQQWNLQLIDLPHSWARTTGSDKIRIAVLDTGVDSYHPDLIGRIDIDNRYNFIAGNTNTEDDHGHGTHVAGIIGSTTDNALGIAGTTWQGEILPVKVLDEFGGGGLTAIAEGILYAAGLLDIPQNPDPVDIINLSIGGYGTSDALEEAVTMARDSGVLIVASSGNDGEEPIMYPARYPETIAVGAANSYADIAYYSNYGPELDFIAPGGDDINQGIISTYPDGEYAFMAGTSMAAPHVAGVIGLMLADGVRKDDVREILRNTALHPGPEEFSPEYGYGLINSNWALNETETIKIMVGERQGDIIEEVAETTIPLGDGDYLIPELPAGEYRIYAWIDSNGDEKITPGDYLTESGPINFTAGANYYTDLVLTID